MLFLNTGQALIQPLELECEPFVINAHAVKDSGIQVIQMDGILGDVVTEIIRLPVRVPAANPTKKFRANFISDLLGRLQAMRGDRPLVLALLGNTYFNFLGALLLLLRRRLLKRRLLRRTDPSASSTNCTSFTWLRRRPVLSRSITPGTSAPYCHVCPPSSLHAA